MTEALCRSLVGTLERLYVGRRKPKVILDVVNVLTKKKYKVSEDMLINVFNEINNRIIADNIGTGLLLIIDELGKFLEYATLYPKEQDIYLLQSIAEIASRSADKPIFVISFIHQGFQAYAHNLSEVSQREWEKIAARFEQILFDQPLEQLTELVSYALNLAQVLLPERINNEAKFAMKKAMKLGWFGAIQPKSSLNMNASRIYPLHPAVLPVLAKVFQRFGQNERSLFSFLLSNEPFGLQSFSNRPLKSGEFYCLHQFYDYVHANFGHRLSVQSYRSHWNHIDSMIQSYMTDNALELCILKTIGILNLLDMNDLIPTDDAILLSLSGTGYTKKTIKTTLLKLCQRKKIIYYRGAAGGYCLWPYTSVNLELAYEAAAKSIPVTTHVATKIPKYIKSTPLVARRHYIETGNLRHFEVCYTPIVRMKDDLNHNLIEADGKIVIPLCETEEERQEALLIVNGEREKWQQCVIVAIPPPLNNLAGLMAEVERWEWVSRNIPELSNDRFAMEEVSRQAKAALMAFTRRLQAFVGVYHHQGETSLQCYHRGKKLSIKTTRDLLQNISRLCDKIFSDAPCIKNELINRRFPSSAASAARMRLIENMLVNSDTKWLGMNENKKPPEMSLYLSVLKAANIHRETRKGWVIAKPRRGSDPYNIVPAWESLEKILKSNMDQKVAITKIYDTLLKPPYGIRGGLIPLLLAAFTVANQDKIAFYESGSFVPFIESEEFLRLIKAPENFELQYCSISGVRIEILQKLRTIITGEKFEEGTPEILDLVKPLCIFFAELPEHARNTLKISAASISIRQAILSARDPFSLIFEELPIACGIPAFGRTKGRRSKSETDKFLKRLKNSLAEIRMIYNHLLDRIRENICMTFNLVPNINKMRSELNARAERILLGIAEPRLKAFTFRLADNKLEDSAWIESIGALLTSKPPFKWNDGDEERFVHELSLLAPRFQKIEGMIFDKSDSDSEMSGLRVTLTQPDGQECDRVIYIDSKEHEETIILQDSFEKSIKRNRRVGIIAASRALWKNLSEDEDDKWLKK
ncbi:MAG: hypothetical protein GY839_19415 [candidate division Zixibacteria bacterium]|nr:hypothetical protein [candidate division Zixibacteria bacterium]